MGEDSTLMGFSDRALKEELGRREEAKVELDKPQPVENPDVAALRKLCENYIEFVWSDGYHEDNDYRAYIFETAVEAFYGHNVFRKINERTK